MGPWLQVLLVGSLGCGAAIRAPTTLPPRPRECDETRPLDLIRAEASLLRAMILACPEAPVLRFAKPMLRGEDDDYLRRAWQEVLDRPQRDARMLANAASFFAIVDGGLSASLLEEAVRLRPRSAKLRFELAKLYKLHADELAPDPDSEAAARAFDQVAEGLRLADPPTRLFQLIFAAEIALWAGASDQAALWSKYLLANIRYFRRSWHEGNVIHHAHRILGHVALLSGDLPGARRHLLASASGPTSPQLGSFGPNMSLALALLEVGEHNVVLQYLRAVDRIWSFRPHRLSAWIATVEDGGIPDFGANLRY